MRRPGIEPGSTGHFTSTRYVTSLCLETSSTNHYTTSALKYVILRGFKDCCFGKIV